MSSRGNRGDQLDSAQNKEKNRGLAGHGGLKHMSEIATVLPHGPVTPLSDDGPKATSAFVFQKLAHAMLHFGQTTCAVCADCSAMNSRGNREDELDFARITAHLQHTSTPLVPMAVIQPQPPLLVCPTILGME